MIKELRFDDQVAVVTGAGGGLGKAYAILFASRGAKVVVNDLGGSSTGEGNNVRAADTVVSEIKNNGGLAVADYNSVEDGDKIIKTALDNYGRIDILVNNAGILRDRSFIRTSNTDWDMVHNVHLRGSFLVTRAAFPYMKNQKFGRIIMTSSVAGIYGNFGQANYSSAKLGLLGLSNTLAVEGQKYNVNCNTIAPMGGTRLTEGILPPDLFKELTPESISPIVLWLCHRDCNETGGLFEAAGGWFGKYRFERSKGLMCRKSLLDKTTPEDVMNNWEKITDFTDSHHLISNAEAAGLLAMTLQDLIDNSPKISTVPTSSRFSDSGPLSAVGRKESNSVFKYEPKDAILYALGVGVSTKDKDGLKFLYEGFDNFSVLPTFAILPSQCSIMQGEFLTNIPGWTINFSKLLHGEQYIELLRPLPTSGTLYSNTVLTDVLDKGSGAVVIIDVETFNEVHELLIKSQWTIFIVGDGSFGGPRSSSKQIPVVEPPTRMPDAIDTFITSVDQAALYRLNGDYNPLHIDQEFAALGGFEQPILHGLCGLGIAARSVLKCFCENDVKKFKAIKARFAKPVIPGQTLVTSMWKENNRIHFETRVQENNLLCLSGGYVDIVDSDSVDAIKPSLFKCDIKMMTLGKYVNAEDNAIKPTNGLILWNITHGNNIVSQWTFDMKSPSRIIYQGLPSNNQKPLTTITIEESDFLSIFEGTDTAQKLFIKGKMKIAGQAPNFKNIYSLALCSANL